MLNGTPIRPANEVHANDQVQNSLDGITSELGTVRVLLCVRGDAQSEELARYTRNLADRLGASWMATPLPGKRSSRCKTQELERINAVLRLVEALGGQTVRIPLSGRFADNLISFAYKNNVAHIVLAKSERERWYEYSVVRDLMHRAGRIRLYIISKDSPLIGYGKPIVTPRRRIMDRHSGSVPVGRDSRSRRCRGGKGYRDFGGYLSHCACRGRIYLHQLSLSPSGTDWPRRFWPPHWRVFALIFSSCHRFTAWLSTIRST